MTYFKCNPMDFEDEPQTLVFYKPTHWIEFGSIGYHREEKERERKKIIDGFQMRFFFLQCPTWIASLNPKANGVRKIQKI